MLYAAHIRNVRWKVGVGEAGDVGIRNLSPSRQGAEDLSCEKTAWRLGVDDDWYDLDPFDNIGPAK